MSNWDFDCPQFVDFAAALDDGPTTEFFHDVQTNDAVSSESHDLGPKMATPKIKPNEPLKNLPFVNLTTDDEKLATLSKLPARLSKSDGCINKIAKAFKMPQEKEALKVKRRTSFSVNCVKKKRVCPTTPNCLRRTLINSKLKTAKTSEELELQKIAEMQDTLQKHLKLNKINLKRLKMNKAPFTLDKLAKKNENRAPIVKNIFAPSCSKPVLSSNRKLPCQNNVPSGAAAYVKGITNHLENLQIKEKINVVAKRKPPSNVLRDHNAQNKDIDNSKKLPLFEKYNVHGGLKFLPHQENTLPCPFSFDSSCSSLNASKLHSSLSISRNTPYVLENKENLIK